MGRPYVDFEPGVSKQATIPEGALSLGLAGTAPGLVLEVGETVVVVLPGPPGELQRLWAEAVRSEPVRRVSLALARRSAACSGSSVRASRRWRRLWPRRAATVTASRRPSAHATSRSTSISSSSLAPRHARTRSRTELVTPLERYLFSRDERRVEELVLDLCREKG